MNERVGAAAVINCHFQNGETTCRQLSKRLSDNSTIFAAEATAISLALNYYQHGPSPSRRNCLLWLNVLFAGNWGRRHQEPFYLPNHEPALVTEWQGHMCSFLLDTETLWHWGKWKSGLTSNEATGQLLHSEFGSNKWHVAVHGSRYFYLVKPTLASSIVNKLTFIIPTWTERAPSEKQRVGKKCWFVLCKVEGVGELVEGRGNVKCWRDPESWAYTGLEVGWKGHGGRQWMTGPV